MARLRLRVAGKAVASNTSEQPALRQKNQENKLNLDRDNKTRIVISFLRP